MQEKQITLQGEIAATPPRFGVATLARLQVLSYFYNDLSERGLSLVELRKRLFDKMCENTLSNSLHFLIRYELICLVANKVGPNKCRKYYKITEKGAIFYELNK